MTKVFKLFFFSLSLTLMFSIGQAETVSMSQLMAKAPPEVSTKKLLQQITLVPSKDPKSGQTIMKVTKIEKDSFWEKELKVGDFVEQ